MKSMSAVFHLSMLTWQSMKMYGEVTAFVNTVSFVAANAAQSLNFEFLRFEKCSQDSHVLSTAQL
jgi:hypothetical protein